MCTQLTNFQLRPAQHLWHHTLHLLPLERIVVNKRECIEAEIKKLGNLSYTFTLRIPVDLWVQEPIALAFQYSQSRASVVLAGYTQ